MASKILKQASLEKPSDAASPCVLLWNQVSLRVPRAQKSSSALCKVTNSLCHCAEGLFFIFFPELSPFSLVLTAAVQPRLIQGIQRGDGFGEFTGYNSL